MMWPYELQHTRLPCPSLSPWVCLNSRPLSHPTFTSRMWCHSTISSSVIPFSSCPQSFPASVSFPVSQLFASDGQNIGASASVLPMNIPGWFPLGLTGLISLHSKGLSRVFSSTTVWKHQFFGVQPSLWSNSHYPNFTSLAWLEFISYASKSQTGAFDQLITLLQVVTKESRLFLLCDPVVFNIHTKVASF